MELSEFLAQKWFKERFEIKSGSTAWISTKNFPKYDE